MHQERCQQNFDLQQHIKALQLAVAKLQSLYGGLQPLELLRYRHEQGVIIMTFGEKLQLLRKQKGLSQEQLALQLTVSRQSISKWELDSSLPDTENIVQLSSIFNVSTDYLLKESEENECAIPPAVQPPTQNRRVKLLPTIMMLLGGGGVILFWILSSVFPAVTSYSDASPNGDNATTIVKHGLSAFLDIHNVEPLFLVCCITFIIGAILLCCNIIKNKGKRPK